MRLDASVSFDCGSMLTVPGLAVTTRTASDGAVTPLSSQLRGSAAAPTAARSIHRIRIALLVIPSLLSSAALPSRRSQIGQCDAVEGLPLGAASNVRDPRLRGDVFFVALGHLGDPGVGALRERVDRDLLDIP